jgi:HEAT repeat protein
MNDMAAGMSERIQILIGDLRSPMGTTRERAREELAETGSAAIPALTVLLMDPSEHVRWEATKAIAGTCSVEAVAPLVGVLEDPSFAIRWLAAEGLICTGRGCVVPLLRALTQRSESGWVRDGAHHVFSVLARKGMGSLLHPVLQALDDVEPAVAVPAAAVAALKRTKAATQG